MVIDWLESPCTEHRLTPTQSQIFYRVVPIILQEPHEWYFEHRKDCPICWNDLKKEIE